MNGGPGWFLLPYILLNPTHQEHVKIARQQNSCWSSKFGIFRFMQNKKNLYFADAQVYGDAHGDQKRETFFLALLEYMLYSFWEKEVEGWGRVLQVKNFKAGEPSGLKGGGAKGGRWPKKK